MFTVIMAVFNAPGATKLTLKTLYESSFNHISKIIIHDSSPDAEASRVVDEFAAELPMCKVIRRGPTAHRDALHHMVGEDIETPYIFISDSDVEYYNCLHFDEALDMFEDPEIGIIGEYGPAYLPGIEVTDKDGTKVRAAIAERMFPWALFVRTEIAKKHRDSLVDYGLDGGVFYDTAAKFYKAIMEEGHKEHRTLLGGRADRPNRPGKAGTAWLHYTNASWSRAAVVEDLVRSRLDSKVWEKIEHKCRKGASPKPAG